MVISTDVTDLKKRLKHSKHIKNCCMRVIQEESDAAILT